MHGILYLPRAYCSAGVRHAYFINGVSELSGFNNLMHYAVCCCEFGLAIYWEASQFTGVVTSTASLLSKVIIV